MSATKFISYARIMMIPNKTIGSLFLAAFALMLLIGGCGGKQDSPPVGERLSIVVSIQPLSFVVRQVGEEAVDCAVMVPPGRSPATYEPTPRQMSTLSEAQAFVTVGVPYERVLLKKIRGMYPGLRLVDLSSTVVDSSLLENQSELTDHGDHQHGDTDPHVWMDPRNVRLQAKVITELLTDLDSTRADLYSRNLAQLELALDSLHEYMTERLRPVAGAKLYVFHPAYGWMARAYDLHQVPVEVLGKEPGSRQVTEFVRRAREDGVRAVFVQPQMASPAIEAIASEVGAQVVTLDPLSGDYLANMRLIADSLAVWLGPGE